MKQPGVWGKHWSTADRGVQRGILNLPVRDRLCILLDAAFASFALIVGAPITEVALWLSVGTNEDIAVYMYGGGNDTVAAGISLTMVGSATKGREGLVWRKKPLLLD